MTGRNPIEAMAEARHEFGEHGGVNMSIEASTTFTVMDSRTMPEIFHGEKGPETGGCYLYGRHFNPTVYTLGKQLAALEGTEAAYCTASGMSAIAAVVMQSCGPGDEIVASNTVYGGTYALLHDFLPAKTGIRTRFVNINDRASVAGALTDRTRLVYTESIANPTLRVCNIPMVAGLAHGAGARLVVDNTFSPLILSPGALGADIVVHSMTKFISGASDIIAGAICADAEFIQELMDLHTGALMLLGPTMDPNIAFAINLRLPHLGIRMTEHSRRALEIATRLYDAGLAVVYPGLSSHPDHDLMTELHCEDYGHGGVLTLDLGTEERADELLNVLQNKHKFGYMAVSLGYFDTLMSCSGCSTSSEMTEEDKASAGISPGLLRMSIGLTGTVEQRWHQMEGALRDCGVIGADGRRAGETGGRAALKRAS